MTKEQAEVRREIFTNNINRLRKGESISHENFLGIFPKSLKFYGYTSIVFVNLGLILLGFQSTNITTFQFILFSAISIVLLLLVIILASMPAFISNILDNEFAYKKKEDFNQDQQKQIEKFYKSQDYFARKLKGKDSSDSDNRTFPHKQKNKLASGTIDKIFNPDEVDLYVQYKPLEVFIFHGKIIDYDISQLIYDSEDHSLIIVMNNKIRYDLGVILSEPIRTTFLKADEVKIERTKNGEVVEGITVPFFKK